MQPSTTGTYTYLHTLSLHDALPTSGRNARRVLADQPRSAASRRASSIGVAVPTKARTSPTRSAESAEKRASACPPVTAPLVMVRRDEPWGPRPSLHYDSLPAQLGRATCRERVCEYV